MENSSASNMVSKKAATLIIAGTVIFVLGFFGVGGFFLCSHMRQGEASPEQNVVEGYINAGQDEPEDLVYEEPNDYEEEYNEDASLLEELPEEEPEIHPIVGIWRLVSTTDHVNADMMEYGFVFYWHAYEDGTAKSRMYSPHSGWHTKEEYTWSTPYEGQLEEVITYVNIEATEMYLGPEFAAMIGYAIGMVMTSYYDIEEDTFTQTMPYLTLVYLRVEDPVNLNDTHESRQQTHLQ